MSSSNTNTSEVPVIPTTVDPSSIDSDSNVSPLVPPVEPTTETAE